MYVLSARTYTQRWMRKVHWPGEMSLCKTPVIGDHHVGIFRLAKFQNTES